MANTCFFQFLYPAAAAMLRTSAAAAFVTLAALSMLTYTGMARPAGGAAPARATAAEMGSAGSWVHPSTGADAAPSRGEADPVVDSARAEMAVGRYWHASRLLAPLARDGLLDEEELLLFAHARAGYRDWAGVLEVLEVQLGLGPDSQHAAGTWTLLARAREAEGDGPGAADAYARALEARARESGGKSDDSEASEADAWAEPAVLRTRLARVLWHAERRSDALAAMDALTHDGMRSWLALQLLGGPVAEGDTAAVHTLLDRVTTPEPRDRTWQSMAHARWQAGDTAGAVRAYRDVLEHHDQAARRAPAWLAIGRAALADGDTAAARQAYLDVLDASTVNPAAPPAAAGLADLGGLTAVEALEVARVLDRAGDGRRALAAYDRHVAVSEATGAEPDARARVERARLMATVPDRQEAAIREYRALSTHDDEAVGARTLQLWADLRRRQRRTNDEATLRRWLVERYPSTVAATNVVFFEGDDAHDGGQLERALTAYGRVVEMAPALDRAGLSRMRMGQIHLQRGGLTDALEAYEGYLEAFPEGRRWDEASYWAARVRWALGDTARGLAHLERLQAEEPFSYYAVLTADLLGHPYDVENLPPGPSGAPPDWVAEALDEIDRLEATGLAAAASHHVSALADRARASTQSISLYAVAEGLNERGRTLDGISLGWVLRREGEPWNHRLLQVVYPFPYREMVVREAAEWGVDPFLLAGLIRQESAWVSDIVSSAGAVGLMQVMPATGRGLARQLGVDGFTTASLETPEVNLHLGARFLVDVLERYGPDLPLVLSAYNAGPTRATRWRSFPEAGDPLQLTERIPFTETRGYVKNVTRNLRLYEALYGTTTRIAR
jgi:soluble lytic murein transglycosylase